MALENIPTIGPGALNANLDKVVVYKNGGSEAAVSLLTLTNSALNLSGVYLDSVNGRVGIGVPNPAYPLEISQSTSSSIRVNSSTAGAYIDYRNSSNATYSFGTYLDAFITAFGGTVTSLLKSDGTNTFGNAVTSLGARVGIKGSGSTSATTSLLVQNSSGTELFKVRDDGYVNIPANGGMNIGGLSLSGLTYNGVINFGNNDLSIGCDVNNRRVNLYSGNTNVLTVYKSTTNYGVGISDSGSEYPIVSAVLQVTSTTRGFLKPKMTTAQKNAIVTPAAGLEVYDTDLNRPCFYNGTSWITL
jgi:hypothetical protein